VPAPVGVIADDGRHPVGQLAGAVDEDPAHHLELAAADALRVHLHRERLRAHRGGEAGVFVVAHAAARASCARTCAS
jgi:hypothetical protein